MAAVCLSYNPQLLVCSAVRIIFLVVVSAEIIMSRCVALCLVLGLVAVSGASAATWQAYSPSAQALVREVVSTLKVRYATRLYPKLLMPSSLELMARSEAFASFQGGGKRLSEDP